MLCRLARRPDFPSTPEDRQALEDARIDWQQVHRKLQNDQLISQDHGLTQRAHDLLAELRRRNYGRLEPIPDPEQPRAHYGTFASSESVISIENPFPELAQRMRSVRAIEMEVASLFAAAAEIQVPVLAAKGVSDYATPDKDDLFHAYAAEASVRWLEAFIRRYAHQLLLGISTQV